MTRNAIKSVSFKGYLLAGLCGSMVSVASVADTSVKPTAQASAEEMMVAMPQYLSDTTAEIMPLPSPLSLSGLLAVPYQTSPLVLMQRAQQEKYTAKYQQKAAEDDFELNVVGRLGWREYAQETQDNHLLALHLGKELYDFGQTSASIEAEKLRAEAESTLGQDQQVQYQLELMQSFFNVVLADLKYRVDNEAMAVAFVGLDKAKDIHALKRMSDVDYLKIQSDYEAVLVKRSRSSYEQRRTRATLANLAGQPDNLPDKLVLPDLASFHQREIKELSHYQNEVLSKNVGLQALKLKLKGQLQSLESEKSGDMPSFRLDAWGGQLSTYERNREGRWRVDLSVDYPLYDGGNQSAKVSAAKADLKQIQAKIALTEQTLRDKVADLYFKLKLAKAENKQIQAFGNYADLYLDYSRALYENESATDFGDAMVRLSESNLQVISQEFKEALYWAQLDYLSGQSINLTP